VTLEQNGHVNARVPGATTNALLQLVHVTCRGVGTVSRLWHRGQVTRGTPGGACSRMEHVVQLKMVFAVPDGAGGRGGPEALLVGGCGGGAGAEELAAEVMGAAVPLTVPSPSPSPVDGRSLPHTSHASASGLLTKVHVGHAHSSSSE